MCVLFNKYCLIIFQKAITIHIPTSNAGEYHFLQLLLHYSISANNRYYVSYFVFFNCILLVILNFLITSKFEHLKHGTTSSFPSGI